MTLKELEKGLMLSKMSHNSEKEMLNNIKAFLFSWNMGQNSNQGPN
jgi:hypothetical protein